MNIVAEREWREASDMRRSTLTLTGILAVAALLRFWGLGSGVPHAVEPDELSVVERALRMMRTGDFDPQQFDTPGFYLHVQLVVATMRFLTGATAGAWGSLDDATVERFLLWGRAVSALVGTLTVLLVFHVAMRWGTRYAMLAAGLLAVMPLHARASHHVVAEIPLTFFVVLAAHLALRAHEAERTGAFAAAGAAVGLAAATQYVGIAAAILPLLSVGLTSGRPSRGRALGAAVAGAGGAFVLAAPFAVLNLPGFLNGAAGSAAAHWSGPRAPDATSFYLTLLRTALHPPALILAFAGLVLGVVRSVRGPGRLRWSIAVLFPLTYLWLLRSMSVVHDRLVLPVLPLVGILAAAAVVSGVSLLRRFDIPRAARTTLIVGLTIAALLPPLIGSVRLVRGMAGRSTTQLAYEWVLANVPAGSRVVIEPGAPNLPGTYKVRRVPMLIAHDREEYLRTADYLIASSAAYGPALERPHQHAADYRAYMNLMEQVRELARFTPARENPGPEVRIYALQ